MAWAFWKYDLGFGPTILLGAPIVKRHAATKDRPVVIEAKGYDGMRFRPVFTVSDDEKGAAIAVQIEAARAVHDREIAAAHAKLRTTMINLLPPGRKL